MASPHDFITTFREIESIVNVLETISGSALTHLILALACGLDLWHKPDALFNSGRPPVLPFLLGLTLTVLLRCGTQPFTSAVHKSSI